MWPPCGRWLAFVKRILDNDICNLRGLIEGKSVVEREGRPRESV